MADVKHTPGPWEFDGMARIDAVALRKPTGHKVTGGDGKDTPFMGGLVALPYSCHPDDNDYSIGTHKANALLIAAAPDLLEALQAFVSPWDGDSAQEIEAQTGLATSVRIEQARAAIAKATGGAARATEGSV